MMNFAPFWYWINERHRIYLAKAAGSPKPWTRDPILQQYRFCNVFRELDTVTVWIRQHIREPLADHPQLWFWLALARNINWPDALQDIITFSEQTGFPNVYDMQGTMDVLSYRRQQGQKTFGSAYVITNGGTTLPKEEYVCRRVLQPLWDKRHAWQQMREDGMLHTLKDTWDWLLLFEGFGPFIGYEVVTDLRHTRYLNQAPDIMTWANAGPGAKRGLNRLWGEPAAKALPSKQALSMMRDLLKQANAVGGPVASHVPLPLEMRDIEHSLCETDKYLRAKTGEGKPKVQYPGRA